jgi:hypothetical protein
MGHLRDSFKPPYDGAAAIVAFDAGTVARACRATADEVSLRRDTQVKLANTGSSITILGVKGNVVKTLVLKTPGDLPLFIGNVPQDWVLLPHDQYESHGLPHYQAYYDMGKQDGTDPKCNPITLCVPKTDIPLCEFSPMMPRLPDGGQAQSAKTRVPDIFMISSSECSNSLWP